MRSTTVYISGIILVSLIIIGCEGEAGLPGVNRLGDDLIAPIVELTMPAANQDIYGSTSLEAYIVDDGHIDSVRFIIDGQMDFGSETLLRTEYPWTVRWNEIDLIPGTHFIQALAWDNGGHTGSSAWVKVNKFSPDEAPGSETIRFFDLNSSDEIRWRLPDEFEQFTGYGTRFTINRPGKIVEIRAKLTTEEGWWGAVWTFEVRTSKNLRPDSLLYTVDQDGHKLSRNPEPGEPGNRSIKVSGGISVPDEFFILAMLSENQTEEGDTLSIISDGGYYRNWHGVVRENDVWREFTIGPVLSFNPKIQINIQYE